MKSGPAGKHVAATAVQVLPPLPIGAEHALWGSPAMATDGHRFLWAPNEVDEPAAGSGAQDSASALTPAASAAGAGGLARDLSIIDSVDGQASAPGSTAADAEGPAADAALGDVGGGSFGSGSPVRVHLFSVIAAVRTTGCLRLHSCRHQCQHDVFHSTVFQHQTAANSKQAANNPPRAQA